MAVTIPQEFSNIVVESGQSVSDSTGTGSVSFSMLHYSNINIVISPIENSCVVFLLTKSSSGFTFGTSAPNVKVEYKAISSGA